MIDTCIYHHTERWNAIKEKGLPSLSGERLEFVLDSFFPGDDGRPIVRNAVCDNGRQSLKTELHKRMIAHYLGESINIIKKRDYKDYRLGYGAPTQQQVERIAWNDLKLLIPPKWYDKNLGGKISESDHFIKTFWGAELWLFGLDEPARMEGPMYDGFILDESADNRPDVFEMHVRPALSARQGWSRHLGTPDFAGKGAKKYKGLSDRAIELNNNQWKRYHWPSWEVMLDGEIEEAKNEMSLLGFNQEYGGDWVDAPGRAYWEYRHERNKCSLPFIDGSPIFVCCDFNSSFHNWLLMQAQIPLSFLVDGLCILNTFRLPVFRFFDQIFLENASTESMIAECRKRIAHYNESYLSKNGTVQWYGDYSGEQRRSEASNTNWEQIINAFKGDLKNYHYIPSGPISTRVMKMNDCMYSASHITRWYVDPKCKELITDCEFVNLKDLYAQKGADRTHASDAAGYGVTQFEEKHLTLHEDVGVNYQELGRMLGL